MFEFLKRKKQARTKILPGMTGKAALLLQEEGSVRMSPGIRN